MERKLIESQTKPSRRGFFFGAAATGAAAAVAMALPGVQVAEVAAVPPKPMPEKGGGYSVSEHVERYYKTARV